MSCDLDHIFKRQCTSWRDRSRRGSYHYGMFTTWLMEQQGREDNIGVLAGMCFNDYNAGCALLYKDPLGWMQHFKLAHQKQSELVKSMLGDAYLEYVATLSIK